MEIKKDDLCPFCNQKETVDHLFQCTDSRPKSFRKKQINLFITHLKSCYTDPSITLQIHKHLLSFCNQLEIIPDGDSPTWKALTEQISIGWRQFLCGKISKQWITRQEEYMKKTHSKKSSFLWSVELINRLWKVAWSIWTFRCDFAYSAASQWEIMFKRNLHKKIIYEYEKGPQGAQGIDRRWWKSDMQYILTKNFHYQQTWLLSVEAVRTKLARKNTTLANQRYIMWSWLNKKK